MITKDELLERLKNARREPMKSGYVYRLKDILPEADRTIGYRSWIHETGENEGYSIEAFHVAEGVWMEEYARGMLLSEDRLDQVRVLLRYEPLPMICGGDIKHPLIEGEHGPLWDMWELDALRMVHAHLSRCLESQVSMHNSPQRTDPFGVKVEGSSTSPMWGGGIYIENPQEDEKDE